MGLFSSSWERQVDNSLFDFIDVSIFKNYRTGTLFNFFWMVMMLLLTTALYVVDVYTCVKLLAFDEWSSQVAPYLSFKISKWLFAACIICSVVLLAFDFLRAIRVFRTRNISLIYTNKIAKVAKSLTGYGYFCVLNAINPSSGFDKMAFYTWFTIDGSKKLIFADSPRQVINALTLYSVLNVGNGGFVTTIRTISTTNRSEALILYSMTISFCIWIVFISCLFFALCFCFPVYHKIRQQNYSGLRQYVCVKVDATVKKLARENTQRHLLKEHRRREKLPMVEKGQIPNVTLPPLTPLPKSFTMDSITTAETMDPSTQQFGQPEPSHVNSSQVSLLKRSVYQHQFDSQASVETARLYDSQIFPMRKAPTSESLESYTSVRKDGLLNESQTTLTKPVSYDLPSYDAQPLGQGSNGPQYPPTETANIITQNDNPFTPYPTREFFFDEEKFLGETSTQEVDFDDCDDSGDDNDRVNRQNVRPSLIIRAKDMEDEDYSRFRRDIL